MTKSKTPPQTAGKAPTTYNCPQCSNAIIWNPKNEFRPFCSERCQLIDLGKWANEEYSVPAEQNTDWLNESETF